MSCSLISSLCIQVSLNYDGEVEDLQITLHKVKGQSNRDINDPTDVFINTHIIPDTRCACVVCMCCLGIVTRIHTDTRCACCMLQVLCVWGMSLPYTLLKPSKVECKDS